MNITISPKKLLGTITPPSSKSYAHRLVIAASLANGESIIENINFSNDIKATLDCMTALGAKWSYISDNAIQIEGIGGKNLKITEPVFDCGESGSTLRFLIPVALVVTGGGTFIGHGRLMSRPLKPYFDLFDEIGISYAISDNKLTLKGRLTPREYRLPGDVSSQFFSGLLFALPMLSGESHIVSTTPLESSEYISMTSASLSYAGINVTGESATSWHIYPAAYSPFNATVESDWSQAAFFYAANSLGGNIDICGMNENSLQGDKVVHELSEKFSTCGDIVIDISDCPDLLPPLAVMAAVRNGTTSFVNGARLRLKESDRLSTVAQMLASLGGECIEKTDSLTVIGKANLIGGIVDANNDHRIAMAAAIAATACTDATTIVGADCVNKSYPSFFNDYVKIGGKINVI